MEYIDYVEERSEKRGTGRVEKGWKINTAQERITISVH